MTAVRTLPFFDQRIKPLLTAGQRVLVVAHGNSLRSIVMSLDRFTPEQIVNVSFATRIVRSDRNGTARLRFAHDDRFAAFYHDDPAPRIA